MLTNPSIKKRLLFVSEAALENPSAQSLSPLDQARVNGVYRTYENLTPYLKREFDVSFLTPFAYAGPERSIIRALIQRDTPFATPVQKSIRLVWPSAENIRKRLADLAPDHLHIATEGPLGLMAAKVASRIGLRFTTAFHTNWQQYALESGFGIPMVSRKITAALAQKILVNFHRAASATMAATEDLKEQLVGWGLTDKKIHIVSRGIDPTVFRIYPPVTRPLEKPFILYVGRLAHGKGVEKFCALNTPGLEKVVVGAGPLEDQLRRAFPTVNFQGFAQGEMLGQYYSSARFFVLPSDTETFGMTVIESLACGTPVIALDRGGHQPVLRSSNGLGIMAPDLQTAFERAAADQSQFTPRPQMSAFIHRTRSWEAEAENFRAMTEFSKR